MKQQRDRRIDVLRAWGIILVVLGHSSPLFSGWIYSFHMPLFFFVSGYLRHDARPCTWGEFLIKRVKSCLVPYVCFWAFTMIVMPFGLCLLHGDPLPVLGINEWKSLLLGGQWLAEYSNNFPLWFLQTFFIVTLLVEPVIRYTGSVGTAIVLGISVLVTIPIQTIFPGRPIFHANVIPAGIAFMCMGYLVRKAVIAFSKIETVDSYATAFGLMTVGFVLSGNLGANISEVKSLLYFPGALCTIMGLWFLAQHFTSWTRLAYIGQSTLFILGLHNVMKRVGTVVSNYVLEQLSVESVLLAAVVSVTVTVSLCLLFQQMFNLAKNEVRLRFAR